MTKYFVLKF